MLELYGEGLERIVHALDGGARGAGRPRAGRRRRLPAPDPRPLPGRRSPNGWRRRSRACGRTWSRTAAASSSSGSRAGSPTCACTAAATAVLPRRRRWSSPSGRPSTRPRRTSTGSRSKGSWSRSGRSRSRSPARPPLAPEPGVQPAWVELAGVAGLGIGELTQAQVGVVPLLVANVGGTLLAYRNACAGCGAPLHRAELDGGLLTCAGCRRRFELPLAGRAVGEDLQLAPVPLLEDVRAGQGRGRVIEGGAIRELRRLANRNAVDRRPDEPAAAPRGALRPLLGDDPGRPPPHAPRRGAADRLHLRDLPRALRRRRAVPAGRLADGLAGGVRAPGRAVGVLPDPDRAGVLLPQQHRRRRRRHVPEPGRDHRERARPRPLGRARRRESRARGARDRRRGR